MEIQEQTCTLFKRDSKGKVREWFAMTGTDGTNWGWCAVSGLDDGKKVQSGWKLVEQKNIGKANETSLKEQAVAEMMAEFNKKSERGYFATLSNIDTFEKIKPMLASKYEDAKIDFEKNVYYTQPKLDGIRCIARRDGLWSRAGKEILAVPHIMDHLKVFFEKYPDAILDGELYNHQLRDDFNKITSLVRKTKPTAEDIAEAKELVQYHVYDVIQMPDKEENFFSDRIGWFYGQGFSGSVQAVETRRALDQDQIDRNYGDDLEDGFEGQMIRIDAVYEQNKRSKSLIKRKEFLTDEFPVVAVEEGKGNWSGHIKRFILALPGGTQFGAGVRGTQDTMRTMFEAKQTPLWATLRYFTPTPDGIPRFPVVIDWGFEKERQD
jgi:DNA ligase 1